MAIQIVPHADAYRNAVHEFNLRMRHGGSPWGFYPEPVPDWIPKQDGVQAWREYHLVLEDGATVRGAFALKPQQWWVKGSLEWIADWQGPFSEGAVDPRHGMLALRMMREMLKMYPMLYSTGHGGHDQPLVELLRKLGWSFHGMPFCVRVLHPYRFLRGNQFLRTSAGHKAALDLLTITGIGPLALRAVHSALDFERIGKVSNVEASVVSEFGDWADQLWESCRGRYQCLAVRDRDMMNTLLPKSGWPGGTRLLIQRSDKQPIGWSLVHVKRMHGDARFGDLSVGLITDCFADPSDAKDVIAATHRYLKEQNVDLCVCNQSHPAWIGGLRRNGYLILANKRLLAVSPAMRAHLEPFDATVKGLHLTNLDGHGPHGFTD